MWYGATSGHITHSQHRSPRRAGVRVDLSEVEACLERIPDVAEAAAKAWPGPNGVRSVINIETPAMLCHRQAVHTRKPNKFRLATPS